jgi:FlaA1/EpsC-like NDP-sugar epimerase
MRQKSLAIFVDACIVVNAYSLASLLLFSRWAPLEYYDELILFIVIAVLVHCGVNVKFGLYRAVGRYVGLNQGLRIIQATVVSVAALMLIGVFLISSAVHALTMIPIGGAVAFILMTAVRFYPRIFYERSLRGLNPSSHTLIVGAGKAGEMIVRTIQNDPDAKIDVFAFVDDDEAFDGMEIHGVPIYAQAERIPELVEQKDIDEIIIAIPSATRDEFQRIWQICCKTKAVTKTLRPLQSFHLGKIGISDVKEIEIEDLLGRQPVQTDYSMIGDFLKDKVVLVTGAGGSIGSELTLQISRHGPARIVLIDQDESSLYGIHDKLNQQLYQGHEMCLTDIKSEGRLRQVFHEYRPEIVYHAAAYKHVPLMELYPDQAVLNNIRGTLKVASLAGEFHVDTFVNISTDKAVDPVNIMGATKCLGEKLIRELATTYEETRYCSVRFGNVLGSRGSVIPIFRDQILRGGPVTVTHPEMTRYFMLISEAVDLVIQASAYEDSNAVYVLEMGRPVRIVDLAEQMIAMMEQDESVELVYTGLRPGEKLYEQLIASDEVHAVCDHPKIYRVSTQGQASQPVLDQLDYLFDAASNQDFAAIMEKMVSLVPTFTPFNQCETGSIYNKGIGHGAYNGWSSYESAPTSGDIIRDPTAP